MSATWKRFSTKGLVRELILATNPTVEGEATAHFLGELATKRDIRASRIAHGVPIGGELEYVDGGTLAHALAGRQSVSSQRLVRALRRAADGLLLSSGLRRLAAAPRTATHRPDGIAKPSPAVATDPTVYFKWFQYHAHDAVFTRKRRGHLS